VRPEFQDWSPQEISGFLYDWAHPVQTPSIVKIAPGYNAELWPDCRANGFIRVGWGDIGDLRRFSREEFGAAFAQRFGDTYNGNQAKITEKANEVWTLMELGAGDIVIANRGTSRLVGIGKVRDPGYEHRPDLGEFSHTVAVDWDDTTERAIDPIRRWAFKTIAPVSQAEYQRILAGKGQAPAGPALPPLTDPLLDDIDRAVSRKGQAILFGPPGTGKTYNARRFSVWWLARRDGIPKPTPCSVTTPRLYRRSARSRRRDRMLWLGSRASPSTRRTATRTSSRVTSRRAQAPARSTFSSRTGCSSACVARPRAIAATRISCSSTRSTGATSPRSSAS
jgi:5-methylcytosine-specific restriction protein B